MVPPLLNKNPVSSTTEAPTPHPPGSPHNIIEMCAEPESVSPDESEAMIEAATTAGKGRGQSQGLAILHTLLAAIVQRHDGDPDTTASAIIEALDLDVDHDDLICDSHNVTGMQIDGVITVPFYCPDCADYVRRHTH